MPLDPAYKAGLAKHETGHQQDHSKHPAEQASGHYCTSIFVQR